MMKWKRALAVAFGLMVASVPALATVVSEEERADVDRHLFEHRTGDDQKLFRFDGPFTLKMREPYELRKSDSFKHRYVAEAVFWKLQYLFPAGVFSYADVERGETGKAVLNFVDDSCDIACVNGVFVDFAKGHGFDPSPYYSFELSYVSGAPVCAIMVWADTNDGRILGAAGVVDASIPVADLGLCMLRSLDEMTSLSNPSQNEEFIRTLNFNGRPPEWVADDYLARPGKANSLRWLYGPDMTPGLTRPEFWKAVEGSGD